MTTPSFLSRFLRPFSTGKASFAPYTSASNMPENAQLCTIAAGCFWGVEHRYAHKFGNGKGLLDAKVGYIGGDLSNPSYRQVCGGRTGHAEALQINFDPEKVTYRQLIEYFYRMHDPTTMNRQGPDTGPQYRSAIFYHNSEQEQVAKDVTARAQKEWYKDSKIVTEIIPAGQWWDAEAYHQRYLDNNPGGYDCPSHFIRSFPGLSQP